MSHSHILQFRAYALQILKNISRQCILDKFNRELNTTFFFFYAELENSELSSFWDIGSFQNFIWSTNGENLCFKLRNLLPNTVF